MSAILLASSAAVSPRSCVDGVSADVRDQERADLGVFGDGSEAL
jgi:hypothetical protein